MQVSASKRPDERLQVRFALPQFSQLTTRRQFSVRSSTSAYSALYVNTFLSLIGGLS
jgi:hypothetical protein